MTNSTIYGLTLLMFASLWAEGRTQAQAQIQINRALGRPPETLHEDLEAAMRVEIDAMRRVLALPEASVKKLEVASSVAIKSAMKKNPPGKMQAFGVGGDAVLPTDNDTLSDEDAERTRKKDGDANGPGLPFPNLFMPTVTPETVKKEDIWKKTVINSLSEEQIQSYERFQTARSQATKRLAIQNKVSELDSYLFLTEEQREELSKVVGRVLGESLEKNPPKMGAMGGRGNQVIVMMAGLQPDKDLSLEDVQSILSPLQCKEFQRQHLRQAAGPFGALPPQIGRQVGVALGVEMSSPLGFEASENEKGVMVTHVKGNSEAARAGLLVGDVIDSIGKTPIDTMVQLKRALSSLANAKETTMTVLREGKKIKLNLSRDEQE